MFTRGQVLLRVNNLHRVKLNSRALVEKQVDIAERRSKPPPKESVKRVVWYTMSTTFPVPPY